MTYHWFLAGILVAPVSCGSPQQIPAGADGQDSPPAELSLKAGEERVVAGVKVGFREVRGDSRCPADVQCVWAGDATVVVMVSPGAGAGPSTELLLHTNEEPRWDEALEIRVTLMSLDPAPRSSKPTLPADYVAKLEIRRP